MQLFIKLYFTFRGDSGGADDEEKPGSYAGGDEGDGGAGGADDECGTGGGCGCSPPDGGRVWGIGGVRFPDGNDINPLLVHGTDSCFTLHLPLKIS